MTIQYALISPTKFLDRVSSLGDIHLVLAHLVLRDEAYREYYKNETKYKILDNGAFELRTPLSTEEILKAAELIGADEVVAPDVFLDAEASFNLTSMFTTKVKVLSKEPVTFKVMGVPHGNTFFSWLECFQRLYHHSRIDTIGIGYQSCKVFSSVWPDAKSLSTIRANLVKALTTHFTEKPIHLLGGGSNPIEVLQYKNIPTVRSIDTSFPFLCGQHGIQMDPRLGAERPDNATLDLTCEELTPFQLRLILDNVQVMYGWRGLGRQN